MQAVQDLVHGIACSARKSMDGDWHALWSPIFQEIHPLELLELCSPMNCMYGTRV